MRSTELHYPNLLPYSIAAREAGQGQGQEPVEGAGPIQSTHRDSSIGSHGVTSWSYLASKTMRNAPLSGRAGPAPSLLQQSGKQTLRLTWATQ